MNDATKIQVAQSKNTTETANEWEDYQILLEENNRLLREVETLSKTALGYEQKISDLKGMISVRDLQLSKPKSVQIGRKILAIFHILFGLGLGAFGPVLWLLGKASSDACWGIAGGVVWLIATTVYIDYLSDQEKEERESRR